MAKRDWKRRHDRGRRLPDLVFLPILWMVMTSAVMLPTCAKSTTPFLNLRDFGSQIFHFGQNAYQRVSYLDEMMV